jgi:Fe-S-cluster containining protein
MDDYRAILAKVDAWYRDVKARHPEKVPCARGCRDCCLGLFDVSLADRDLLREGLAAADPAVRADIEARADGILSKLRAIYPDLGETLDGWSPDDVDDLCDALGDVECPVLGPAGECRLYAHRPMTCRMAGVPVVDVTGEKIFPEGCAKCALRPEETPRLDCGTLRREERAVLRRRYPGKSGATLLIPQAVSSREGSG